MEDIVWTGWLQKRGKGRSIFGSHEYQDRYFLVSSTFINYYAAPTSIAVGDSIYIKKESDLLELGFTAKGTITNIINCNLIGDEGQDKKVLIDTTSRTFDLIRCSHDTTDEDLFQFFAYVQQIQTFSEMEVGTTMDNLYQNSSHVHGVSPAKGSSTANLNNDKTEVYFKTAKVVKKEPVKIRDYLKEKKVQDFSVLSEDGKSEIISSREKTIDEMKIQTMYKMVEDVKLNINGEDLEKKVLYLTNKQASMFDDKAIQRCIQALELGKPKCVIILMGSYGGGPWCIFNDKYAEEIGEISERVRYGSEICSNDGTLSQQQLEVFMQSCVLPLAKQTKALIISQLADDCSLSTAFMNVVLPEQTRLGKFCPFQILSITGLFQIYRQTLKGTGLVSQLYQNCNTYASRLEAVKAFTGDLDLDTLQNNDILPSATHYIIFEVYNEKGKIEKRPSVNFRNKLMAMLTQDIPSIDFRTNKNYVVPSDQVMRGIPVLLLDTRERAFTLKTKNSTAIKRELITELAKKSLAFPKITEEDLVKFPKLPDGTCSLQAKREVLHLAFKMIESQINVLADHEILECYETCAFALINSALRITTTLADNQDSRVPLHTRIQEMTLAETANKGNYSEVISKELVQEAADFMNRKYPDLVARTELKNHERYMKKVIESGKSCNWPKALNNYAILKAKVKAIESGHSNSGSGYDYLRLIEFFSSPILFSGSIYDVEDLNRTINNVVKIDKLPKSNTLEALICLQDAWDHIDRYHDFANLYKIITKASYFALLLFSSLIAVTAILSGELDSSTSTEGSSTQYIVLALSMVTTAVAGYINFINPAQRWQQLRGAAHSMESDIWKFRTRSGEYRIQENSESDVGGAADEVLKTRIGIIKKGVLEGADMKNSSFYGLDSTPNKHSQHKNGKNLLPTTSSDIEENSKYSKYSKYSTYSRNIPLFGYGREKAHFNIDEEINLAHMKFYPKSSTEEFVDIDDLLRWLTKRDFDGSDPNETDEVINSHYLPVLPNDYVRFRIEPMLKFYKHRIPLCNRTRHVVQFLSTVGSLGVVIMAFLNLIALTVIVSIVTTAIMAWMEFQGTNNKITRYSSVVDTLHAHRLWWQTLSSIEKSATENIDFLVLTTENILDDEMNAWRSSSANQTKILAKAAAGDTKSEGNGNSTDQT